MWRNKLFLGVVFLAIFLVAIPTTNAEEVILSEDFEGGIPPDWDIDNGVWELCMRTEPDPDFGWFYVATKCGGNYPNNTDSRIITPTIDLTEEEVTGDEEIHLRFWHWFSFNWGDYGRVEIQVYEDTGWSEWEIISNNIGYYASSVWSPKSIDITAYEGKKVRIAFYHIADGSNTYKGWFVDDIQVIKKVPEFTGDFEAGWGDWYAKNGVWQIGTPTSVPGAAYEGSQCAGTVLDNNYPNYTNSRLISPSFLLDSVTGDEEIHLRFWHWFSFDWGDYGRVEIQVYNEDTGWSEWEIISNDIGYYASSVWSPKSIDITAYEGKKVRIAFYHIADGSNTYKGWFVDDIQVIKKVPEPTWDFECGWDDWYVENGVWEVGTPTYGPSSCYSGTGCSGTVLDGTYPNYTNTRLISPSIKLPDLNGYQVISLSFYHWYYYGDDYGYVQISEYNDGTGQWSEWDRLTPDIAGNSAGWTRHSSVDITAWAGKKIRIAFYHIADGSYTYAGWYIDHIRITGFPHFCECDLNQDGMCDMQDWLRFGEDWGRTDCGTPPGSGCWPNDCECDLKHDGSCDMQDWLRFGYDWGQTDCLICE